MCMKARENPRVACSNPTQMIPWLACNMQALTNHLKKTCNYCTCTHVCKLRPDLYRMYCSLCTLAVFTQTKQFWVNICSLQYMYFCITEIKPPHKVARLKSCISELPEANYQTLKMFLDHLRKYVAIYH